MAIAYQGGGTTTTKKLSIKDYQTRLNQLGFNVGTADGIFGAKTRAGLTAFQKAAGITADGIYGSQTAGAMLTYKPPTIAFDPENNPPPRIVTPQPIIPIATTNTLNKSATMMQQATLPIIPPTPLPIVKPATIAFDPENNPPPRPISTTNISANGNVVGGGGVTIPQQPQPINTVLDTIQRGGMVLDASGAPISQPLVQQQLGYQQYAQNEANKTNEMYTYGTQPTIAFDPENNPPPRDVVTPSATNQSGSGGVTQERNIGGTATGITGTQTGVVAKNATTGGATGKQGAGTGYIKISPPKPISGGGGGSTSTGMTTTTTTGGGSAIVPIVTPEQEQSLGTLTGLAESANTLFEKMNNLTADWNAETDPDYQHDVAVLENQVTQMMVARGGLYSSVARAKLGGKVIELELGYRKQAYDKFITERNWLFQQLQFVTQRQDAEFSKVMTLKNYDLAVQKTVFDQNMATAQFNADQKYKSATLAIQRSNAASSAANANANRELAAAAKQQKDFQSQIRIQGTFWNTADANYDKYKDEWKKDGTAYGAVAQYFGVAGGASYWDSNSINAIYNTRQSLDAQQQGLKNAAIQYNYADEALWAAAGFPIAQEEVVRNKIGSTSTDTYSYDKAGNILLDSNGNPKVTGQVTQDIFDR